MNSLVASDMGNDGLEELTKMGIDLGVKPIPVKDCVLGIKHVVRLISSWRLNDMLTIVD